MTIEIILAIAGVFTAVLVGVGAVMYYVMAQTAPERPRPARAGLAATPGVLIQTGAASLTPEASDFAKKVTSIIPRSPKDRGRLQKQFVRAAFQSLTPIAIYSIGQLA